MGKQFMDQFTYLHVAMGIVFYFWGVSLRDWIVIHTVYELFENTELGTKLINRLFPMWPGGKTYYDYSINSIGDTVGAVAGWLSARELDRIGSRRGWFVRHLDV